jgi:hypothetical protein
MVLSLVVISARSTLQERSPCGKNSGPVVEICLIESKSEVKLMDLPNIMTFAMAHSAEKAGAANITFAANKNFDWFSSKDISSLSLVIEVSAFYRGDGKRRLREEGHNGLDFWAHGFRNSPGSGALSSSCAIEVSKFFV